MGNIVVSMQYLLLSNILLWLIVAVLLMIKVYELIKKRTQLKAIVYDSLGRVKEEHCLLKQREILIGKSTAVNMVNIDFSDSEYASSIEEEHASFKRYGAYWYVESRGVKTGLKQSGRDTVYKLRKDIPYRIKSGDIIYISYEKIMIQ